MFVAGWGQHEVRLRLMTELWGISKRFFVLVQLQVNLEVLLSGSAALLGGSVYKSTRIDTSLTVDLVSELGLKRSGGLQLGHHGRHAL